MIRQALLLLALATAGPAAAEQPVRVFAAASLSNALDDIAVAWQAAGHAKPSLAYAASSTLARQIAAGAPADVFASADRSWMDYLDARGRIAEGSRTDLLGNSLVLIAPRGRAVNVTMARGFDLSQAFSGRLCTGDPDIVPAGIYARDALQSLGWWDALKGRMVGTDDVRAALAFVERGECPLGIVYATDARISRKVDVVGAFPPDAHAPIVYPFAAVAGARPQARAFLQFVQTSPEAAAVFEQHGFTRLPR